MYLYNVYFYYFIFVITRVPHTAHVVIIVTICLILCYPMIRPFPAKTFRSNNYYIITRRPHIRTTALLAYTRHSLSVSLLLLIFISQVPTHIYIILLLLYDRNDIIWRVYMHKYSLWLLRHALRRRVDHEEFDYHL